MAEEISGRYLLSGEQIGLVFELRYQLPARHFVFFDVSKSTLSRHPRDPDSNSSAGISTLVTRIFPPILTEGSYAIVVSFCVLARLWREPRTLRMLVPCGAVAKDEICPAAIGRAL
jgi:hypothetical protein